MVIYKYALEEDCIVEMPEHSHVLDAQMQGPNEMVMWVCRPVEGPLVKRHFRVIGTGVRFDTPRAGVAHVATVQAGPFVWHVFEVYDQ